MMRESVRNRLEAVTALSLDVKRCPFCGSVPCVRVGQEHAGGDYCDLFILECTSCEVRSRAVTRGPWGYPKKGDLTREEAIQKCRTLWNTRTE